MPELQQQSAAVAQRKRWEKFEEIRRRIYDVQSEIMEHAIPSYSQARGICDALQAIVDAIPDPRGGYLHVTIEVRYHR